MNENNNRDNINNNVENVANEIFTIIETPKQSVTPEPQSKHFPIIPVIATISLLIICLLVFLIFRTIGGFYHKPVLSDEEEQKDEEIYTPVTVTADKELRGVWVASVSNINFPSKQTLSVEEMKSELDAIVETARSTNLNAIFSRQFPPQMHFTTLRPTHGLHF